LWLRFADNPFDSADNPFGPADNPFDSADNPFGSVDNPSRFADNPFGPADNSFDRADRHYAPSSLRKYLSWIQTTMKRTGSMQSEIAAPSPRRPVATPIW
jgi:hypothetical protein